MENSISSSTLTSDHCAACFTGITNEDIFCTNCGYPLKGTETEQKNFITKRDFAQIDLEEFDKKIKRARNTFYYLSGFFLLSGLISIFTNKNNPDVLALVVPSIILAIIFLGLGGYSRKKPMACIISGLSLYIIVQILNFISNPASIAYGIIFKIIIIGYLINAIKSALEIEKIKKENNIA